MRTLVCLLGQARFPEFTLEPWKKWVLDPLKADLILCGNVEPNNQFRQFAKYVFDPEDASDLSLLDGLPGHLGASQGAGNCGRLTLHLRNDLWNNLVKHGLDQEYDSFIISRSDYVWTGPHPILDQNYIWCMNGEFHLGLCDRHMVIPRRFLKDVITIAHFENPEKTIGFLREKYNEGILDGYAHCLFNLESFMYCRFKERGILEHVGLSPFPMHLIYSNGEPKFAEELDADQKTLTWPYTIIHNYISPKSGFFSGRALK
jgi:hypothetical protein